MALTYLDSAMIQVPVVLASLSAQNLQVLNLTATNLQTSSGNPQQWNETYTLVRNNSASWEESQDVTTITTTVQSNSAKWENVYTTVNTLSGNWEESADILPTITNYLSTSNVLLSSLTVTGNISATGTIFSSNTLTTSICAMSGNGTTPFVMNFTNGLLTSITS